MKVYLDNAATTPLDNEVLEAMLPYLKEDFGNPSSIHAYGRKTRSALEKVRKSIARLLNVTPAEIFFTSGGTEADNMALVQSIETLGITHAVSSQIEHHAVEHTLKELEKAGKIKVSWVRTDSHGNVDLKHLEELLEKHPRSLVSLMHANNEIGTLLPFKKVGELCEKYQSIFHSDTVQSMGHFAMDLRNIKVHLVTCAAHKFHGPKGVGFIYINHALKLKPFINGGAQERNMRGGTENVYGIVGLGKAFEIAHRDMEQHQTYIRGLKNYMIELLKKEIPEVGFNGEVGENSLYTVLNVHLPPSADAEMLLFNLDIKGIAASGGSACASGSDQGSHVLRGLGIDVTRPSVRFSFSKHNTREEIAYAVETMVQLIRKQNIQASIS